VNFWAPSGKTNFRALRSGELFLFKLHAPDNFIVGGGIFSHASNLPMSLAWEAFGTKNGAPSLAEMRTRIARYRKDSSLGRHVDPLIGCRILTTPFFWPREKWIPIPANWGSSTVVGKRYSTDDAAGQTLWRAVVDRSDAPSPFDGPQNRYGDPVLVKPRLGQGAFRVLVTDSYERRCAVSGERTLPILDAAHIRSYAEGGEHEVSNGLLLRTDIHRLFDLGYVTIDEDRRFVVSSRLKADFDNGKHYYDLQGTALRTPLLPSVLPATQALAWHREHRFLG